MARKSLTWNFRSHKDSNASAEKPRRATVSEKRPEHIPSLDNASNRASISEKQSDETPDYERGPSMSVSSMGRNPSLLAIEEAIAEDRVAKRAVRTIPPWVRDADEDDLIWAKEANLLPSPQPATVAQHNHTPSTRPGKLQDHARTANAYTPTDSQHQSRWVAFARANAYPREPDECKRVDEEWLNTNFGDYSKPWLAGRDENEDDDDGSRYHAFRRKRKAWYIRSQNTILKNPMIPLAFRLTVFIFSAVALSLGGSIHHYADKDHFARGPSAEMAIVVDVIAMFYTIYITYDEYFSKPLGLRPIRAKLRLVFLDLFFIVFQAANLALAFESLQDSGESCVAEPGSPKANRQRTNVNICDRQQALASVLLIALIAWLMTFSVSVLRLVESVVQS